MKNLKTKLQSLRQRAEQLKQAVESAPARAERLRGAVHSAAGQFQQLRSEVQGTVSALRMNDDTQLAAAMVEIGESEGVFLEAGYQLTSVDLEPGLNAKLSVRLEKLEDVREPTLRALQTQNRTKPTLVALLSAMVQAQATAESLTLPGLEFRRLTVHLGLVPSIQIGWRGDDDGETPFQASGHVPAAIPAPPPLPQTPSPSLFFERPEQTPVSSAVPAVAEPVQSRTEALAPTVATPSPTVSRVKPLTLSSPRFAEATTSTSSRSTGDWRKDALAKFKQMPDLNR